MKTTLVPFLGWFLLASVVRADDRPLWVTLEEDSGAGQPPTISSFARLVERARPAVVAVHTLMEKRSGSPEGSSGGSAFPFNPWRLFPEVPRREREEGMGSGFIIREDGYILTNHHVVADASTVMIRIQELGGVLQARVVGSDSRSDIALLKVDPPRPLPVLPLGSSEDLPVGGWVVAIGNPFGLTHVATKGIVSGKGRTLGDLPRFRSGYYDFIQTDAAIDRGNSGGPLINLRGEVMGINTAINSRARGIGFAVPVDLAKAVLPHLSRSGRVVRSYLGISIDPVTWEIGTSFGMERPRGVLITRVMPDTPAQRAGLRKGDILLGFAGHRVRGPGDMSWRASTAPAGTPVEIEIWRSGGARQMTVVPVVRESEPDARQASRPADEPASPPRLGLLVVTLDQKTAAASKLPEATRGVVVVGVEADAALQGIHVGDVITSVNGAQVSGQEEFEKLVAQVERNEMIRFYILRLRGALYVALPKRWD